MCEGGYRIMAIIRGFQPFDESSILSTRSISKYVKSKKQAMQPAFYRPRGILN